MLSDRPVSSWHTACFVFRRCLIFFFRASVGARRGAWNISAAEQGVSLTPTVLLWLIRSQPVGHDKSLWLEVDFLWSFRACIRAGCISLSAAYRVQQTTICGSVWVVFRCEAYSAPLRCFTGTVSLDLRGKGNTVRISDIETLRKMMHLCIYKSCTPAITPDPLIGLKLDLRLDSDLFITLFKAPLGEGNSAPSSPLSVSHSWFYWWLWLLWLPAPTEVFSPATAASLHVSHKRHRFSL